MSPGPTEELILNRSTRAAAVAAALIVTLPVAASEGTDALPASAAPPAEAAVYARPPSLVAAGPVRIQPAGVAPLARTREAVGDAPVRREARPASRSMTRRSRPHVKRHRIVERVAVKRTSAKPVRHRVVVRAVARKTPRARSGIGAAIAYARSAVGAGYGTGRGKYDCSLLTQRAYLRAGITLPRTSHAQGRRGRAVSTSARKPGDLMYWPSGHVAIYVGAGRMIDAGNPRVGVSARRVWGAPRYRRF